MKQPKYKPGDILRYLDKINVEVENWYPGFKEYRCYNEAWNFVYCQEKDLKPIEDKTNE